jgi:hypothetical protein
MDRLSVSWRKTVGSRGRAVGVGAEREMVVQAGWGRGVRVGRARMGRTSTTESQRSGTTSAPMGRPGENQKGSPPLELTFTGDSWRHRAANCCHAMPTAGLTGLEVTVNPMACILPLPPRHFPFQSQDHRVTPVRGCHADPFSGAVRLPPDWRWLRSAFPRWAGVPWVDPPQATGSMWV